MSLRLRSDLEVERLPGNVRIGDPVMRRWLDLGDIGAWLGDLDAAPAAVRRTLTLLCLTEGPGASILERMRRLRAGEPMGVIFLPGARFQCQGSGGCCHNYVFGPLTDADVERVGGHVGDGFHETRPDGTRYLRTTAAGDCVFLERGNRCGLHARFGATSKPGFCQLFPLVAQPTLSGLRVSDNGECARFPESARAGPSLAEPFVEVQDLVPASMPLQHPVVVFAPGVHADFGFYEPLRDALVDAPDLRAAGALALAYVEAVREVDAEPEARLAQVLTAPPPPLAHAPNDAVASLAAELRDTFAAGLAQPRPPPFTHEICALLDAIAGGEPPPPPHPDMDALFRLSMRHYFFGQRALVGNRPVAAILRLAMGWHLVRQAPDFATGHLLATRRLYMDWPPLVRLFVRREAETRALLEGLPPFP